MLCAGVVTAQFVAGTATRDALFLASLPVTALPTMVVATAIFSMALVTVSSKTIARLSPARFVPLMFAASAIFLLAEWVLAHVAPGFAAVLVYLHIAGLGPLLGSGFWLLATERFDPRTAKMRFGQIAGAGTIGGLLGGLLSERVAVILDVSSMLPLLAVLNVVCAWLIHRLAGLSGIRPGEIEFSPDLAPEPARSGLRVLAEAPYLRHLAALVLLGTTGAALVDYAFKVQAVAALGNEAGLLRFFSAYYAATSLITFVVQTSLSRLALEKLGLAFTTSTPSLALLVGCAAGLYAPGLQGMMIARGGETVFRGSLFRAGYELFYTPLPQHERRAAKSLIDVGFDRLGDALAGGTIGLVLLVLPSVQYQTILILAIACSAAAVAVASRLNRGYILTLERSLLDRAVEMDLSEVEDATTRTTMLRTLRRPKAGVERRQKAVDDTASAEHRIPSIPGGVDPELHEIAALRSRDRERILGVLRNEKALPASLVPHVIPLLAWDPVADDAVNALRRIADERVGELIDALVDPHQDFTIRRRLARVFSVCTSQRAADGLMLGLDDLRFEVRFHCGRSLAAVLEKNPGIRLDKERVLEVVRREVTVGRPVWEGHRLLDRLDDRDNVLVDNFVRDRASQSLAHVFVLLSLVLPTEPLQIAFRGLYTDDANLRGTALEYLEGVLPATLRDRLWPFLEDHRPASRVTRPREEILADLVRSNPSILMNLEELKRRAADGQAAETELKGMRIR
jgi:AAA family ATP:ADP antiporter